MSEQFQFTGVFRGVPNPDDHRITTKRNRQPLSCSACRARKLKCSRHQPCEACIKRDEGSACSMESSSGNSATVTKSRSKTKKSKAEAQARLKSLEEMVNTYIRSEEASPVVDTPPIDVPQKSHCQTEASQEVRAAECLSKDGGEMIYVGATHWATILENIKDIHEYLDSSNGVQSDPITPSENRSDFFLGPLNTITMADVLSSIPRRDITDNLMSVYFTMGRAIAVSWLHTTKFRREYEAFWNKPNSMSFMWLSTLFSALSIAATVATTRGKDISGVSVEMLDPVMFRTRAGQCLVTGDYLKPQAYVVESLLLYCHTAFVQHDDDSNRSWSILSITTRLAQRMGYHRDPKYLPSSANITPYEAEMRRRVWMFVNSFDLFQSLKLGLPAIIHEEECDTGLPRNLYDEDFDETTTTLPPSRPYTDVTPMLFPCYKSRYIKLLRRISRLTMSTQRPDYEEVMKIDAQLRLIHNEVPPSLKMRPVKATSFSDESNMITKRMIAEMLYLKCLCILHLAYLTHGRGNLKFEPSRKACQDAALQILDIQIESYKECLLGGRLYEERWTIFSSTLYDFLLAAVIVCVDVYETGPTT